MIYNKWRRALSPKVEASHLCEGMTEVKKVATPRLLAHAGRISSQPRLREEHENRDRTVGEAIRGVHGYGIQGQH